MIIDNQTTSRLTVIHASQFIASIEIEPATRKYVPEHIFDTNVVKSKIGKVIITTEYCERSFESHGHITAYESDEVDDNDMKVIVIENMGKAESTNHIQNTSEVEYGL